MELPILTGMIDRYVGPDLGPALENLADSLERKYVDPIVNEFRRLNEVRLTDLSRRITISSCLEEFFAAQVYTEYLLGSRRMYDWLTLAATHPQTDSLEQLATLLKERIFPLDQRDWNYRIEEGENISIGFIESRDYILAEIIKREAKRASRDIKPNSDRDECELNARMKKNKLSLEIVGELGVRNVYSLLKKRQEDIDLLGGIKL